MSCDKAYKVSIIVPVYNVESYLKKCIDSILLQTYTNFELILIDDGSTDQSYEICDEYSLNDKRIKVIHKINEGVSKVRNLGLSISTGDYICFVDSDDWIDCDMLEYIIVNAEDFDIVQFGFRRVGHAIVDKGFTPENIMKLQIQSYFGKNMFNSVICGYAIKNEIVRNHNITFPTYIKYGEDQAFILKVLLCCENILILNKRFYNYLDRDGSAMNCSYSLPMAENHLYIIEDVCDFASTNKRSLSRLHFNKFENFIQRFFWISVQCSRSFRDFISMIEKYNEWRNREGAFCYKSIKSMIFNTYIFAALYYFYVKMKH